jgi:hypothetical protein
METAVTTTSFFTDGEAYEKLMGAAQTALTNSYVAPIRKMAAADVERLKSHLRKTTPTRNGRISYLARANAVKGRVPS